MTNDVMTYFSGEICFQHPQKYQKPLHSNILNNVKKYFSTSRPCKEIFERILIDIMNYAEKYLYEYELSDKYL